MKPTLRFPEFSKEWQAKHGEDVFKSRRQRAKKGLPLYSVTIEQGMIRRDTLEREFTNNSPDEANLRAFKDDHVYNMMRMWQGAVGRAPEDCMVSPAYVVLQPKSIAVPAFFDHWFRRNRSLYLFWAYSYGLTNDRLRLYASDFGRIPMILPDVDEQRKIAEFLAALDDKIKLLHRRRAALERYKTHLMRGLFQQSIRFERDDGSSYPDWKRLSFARVATRRSEKFDPVGSNEYPMTIELENIESGTGRIVGQTKFADQVSLKGVFEKGDILFGKLRPYLKKYWLADQSGVCSSEIWVLQAIGALPEFVFYLVQTEEFIRNANQSSGSKMPRADWSVVAKTDFLIPDPAEQQKIAKVLRALDQKLDAASKQAETMQAFKKSLMQKMFV